MGIIKRTPADALKDAATATRKAEELEAKATEADETSQRMDAESMAALIDNPGQAEGITAKISAQERLARAYRMKAAEHRGKVTEHRREALSLEADQLDRDAEKVERDAEKVAEKVDAARQALEHLDGYSWEREPIGYDTAGKANEWSAGGAADDLRGQAGNLRLAALHNRFYLENGKRASFVSELTSGNVQGPTSYDAGRQIDPEFHTSDLLAQIASGTVETVEV